MSTRATNTTIAPRHAAVRCVQCGLPSTADMANGADTCPQCGCDLLSRPPRSYAQMEGLAEDDGPHELDTEHDPALAARLDAAASRWLILLMAVTGGCVLAVAAAVAWAYS